MHGRIDRGRVQLITARSALDWTSKYPGLAAWLKALPVTGAYLDGELCALPFRGRLHEAEGRGPVRPDRTRHTGRAIAAARASKPNASTAKSSSWWAGRIQRAPGPS
jgi:hypothetical protein